MSRPSFQFYPDDWLTDIGLRRCSAGARAAWMDMICLMHQGEPYGYLASKTGALPVKFLAQTCGVSVSKLASFILELEQNGVFSRDTQTVIFSRRMVKDERIRLARSTGGGQSVNHPNVPKAKEKASNKDTLPPEPPRVVQVSGGDAEDVDVVCTSSLVEFPETAAAIRGYFPATDDMLVIKVVHGSMRAYADATSGKRAPPLSDIVLSEAVHAAKFNKQTSAGPFITGVPRCVRTWAEQAIRQGTIR